MLVNKTIANIGVNNAEFTFSDNNDVDQSNDHSIIDVKFEQSSVKNTAENKAEFHNSDNNDVSQNNDQ